MGLHGWGTSWGPFLKKLFAAEGWLGKCVSIYWITLVHMYAEMSSMVPCHRKWICNQFKAALNWYTKPVWNSISTCISWKHFSSRADMGTSLFFLCFKTDQKYKTLNEEVQSHLLWMSSPVHISLGINRVFLRPDDISLENTTLRIQRGKHLYIYSFTAFLLH